MISFVKMHGLGNDFVIIDGRQLEKPLSNEQIRLLADRKIGIGCDQLIVLENVTQDRADVFMRIYNPDASQPEACGNATRCVAWYIMKNELKGKTSIIIETVAGLLLSKKADKGRICVTMGQPILDWRSIPLSKEQDTVKLDIHITDIDGQEISPVAVNMGNPHAVFFVNNVSEIDVENIGPKIEYDPIFPERVNASFVEVIDKQHLRMRVWERGAGITLACGSAACAVLVSAVRRGLSDRKATIEMDGGCLDIEWNAESNDILMTGPIALVYKGQIEI